MLQNKESHIIEAGVYKFKSIYLNYSLSLQKNKPLVIVFSGVDSVPGRCITSYYNYQYTLDASVLHIVDNFGAHGNYLLSIARDFTIREAVCGLIKEIQVKANSNIDNTYFIGTSKGASSALCYSLILGGGTCIIGEPQILIGDFLYHEQWLTSLDSQSIAYVMCGSINELEKSYLNEMIDDIFIQYGAEYKGKIFVHYGKSTGYYWRHIRHIDGMVKKANMDCSLLQLIEHNISNHNDIIPIFQNLIGTDPYLVSQAKKSEIFYDLSQWKLPVISQTSANMNDDFRDGIHQFYLNDGLILDLCFQGFNSPKLNNHNVSVVLVAFNGAIVPRNGAKAPFFSGLNIAKTLELPIISISDPLLALDSQIPMAWYAGNESNLDLPIKIAQILDTIASTLNVKLVLFGGSAGGYAAVQIASFLKSETSVLIWNPQTAIADYLPEFVYEYIKIALQSKSDILNNPDAINKEYLHQMMTESNLMQSIRDVSLDNNIQLLYMQNRNDWHTIHHAFPYVEGNVWTRIGNSTFKDETERSVLYLGDWGDGHTPPSKEIVELILKKMSLDKSVVEIGLELDNGMNNVLEKAKYFQWFGSEPKFNFDVIAEYLDTQIHISCIPDSNHSVTEGINYAFYILVDGVRHTVRWYEQSNEILFETQDLCGKLAVMAFAKDTFGQVVIKKISLN
ncbi:MAG: hypothetical protein PHQ90_10125 [Sulfuricurvum sp.]|nr:hypothetical protein [Sulfuricurvum sp.]